MNEFAIMAMQADLRRRERIAQAGRERLAQSAARTSAPAFSGVLFASIVLFVRIVRMVIRHRSHQSMLNRTAS